MKKILFAFATLALGLGAFGFMKQPKATFVSADAKSDAVGILRSYATGGKYIKKTQIFLNIESIEEIKTHFHAGSVSLERTTYYDENVGGLLMGDYDGSFTTINSGYINDATDENKINHFRYRNSASPSVSDLFTERNVDWSAKNQRVGDYYPTLTSLANLSDNVEWKSFELNGFTVYRHYVWNDAEQDTCFGKFQYFAAPLLLVDKEYMNFNSVWVIDTGDFLSIRLYADKTESGKSTMTPGENEVLISEARVYKGISSFDPGSKWYLKGDMNGWSANESYRFHYSADNYNPLQFKLLVNLSANSWFKVNCDDTWWGYEHLTDKTNFWRWGEYGDGNASANDSGGAGLYTLYLQPRFESIIPVKA